MAGLDGVKIRFAGDGAWTHRWVGRFCPIINPGPIETYPAPSPPKKLNLLPSLEETATPLHSQQQKHYNPRPHTRSAHYSLSATQTTPIEYCETRQR